MDPTDLDALLIGALYGELTPADEARLTAHLESHPADRTALADLTWTRTQLRESRLLSVQLDPPQSVTALILQEAVRRAPRRETEGWFQRFVRSLTAHPAMAAAMTLVLVVGVAGTLYMRHADGFGEAAPDMMRVTPTATVAATSPSSPTAAGSAAQGAFAAEGAAAPAAPGGAPADPELAKADKAAGVASAEEQTRTQDNVPMAGYANSAPAAPAPSAADEKVATRDRSAVAMAPPPPPAAAAAPARRLEQGIEVRGDTELAPKDLADAPRKPSDGIIVARKDAPLPKPSASPSTSPSPKAGRVPGAGGGGGAADDADLRKFRAADQDAATGSAVAQAPAPTPAPSHANMLRLREEHGTLLPGTEDGWAQKQHEQVVAYVRANNCRAAATAASEIYNRAPDYYAANVEVDRAVRPCLPYLNTERERTDRAKAAKRAEPSPTATPIRK